MRLFRPRSFFSLLLAGFFFVSLPLLTALFSSIQIMEGLVQQSAVAVFRSVNRVDSSRKVIDLLHNQERKARLYNVLGEPALLREVNAVHDEVEVLFESFAAANADNDLFAEIERLRALENHLVAALNKQSGGPEKIKKEQESILGGYSEIGEVGSLLEQKSNKLMVEEVEALRRNVEQNQNTLVWQVSALIGFSVLLVVLFISLIVKPVSQIDKSIERLGEGDFSTPIAVSGTKDLEMLGEKLDWLRKRLDKLDREKVKMIAHISHDLKTPLASIREGTAILKDGLVGPMNTSQQEITEILDTNCIKLQKLIENILDFNMARAREAPVDLEEMRMDDLVAEVAADHHNSILARKINLELETCRAVVAGNRKQLRTVFDNLIGNAVKFTPENGHIRIRIKIRGAFVTAVVEDDGPGVDAEDRSQIFSPFFKGKQKNQSVVKGSGLGLAISKEYVQNCGGHLKLLSSTQGARFQVTLPLVQDTPI